MPAEVIVVLPGIMGSVLKSKDGIGDQVWPPLDCSTLSRNRFTDEQVEALMRPDVVSTDLIRSVWVKKIYSPLLSLLERYGYKEKPKSGLPTLYPWHYDWRRDIRDSATRLAAFLDERQRERNGDVEFTLLAHSMGGLVARTYLEYAVYAKHAARAMVKRLFTFGTPHLGAPKALAHIRGELGMLWLSADQVKRTTNDPQFPSTYQLLPPPDEPYLWQRTGTHVSVPMDVGRVQLLGLNKDCAKALTEWRAGLDLPGLLASGIRVFGFVSSTHRTITSLWWREKQPGDPLELSTPPTSGDGTVPIGSACLPRIQHYEVEGEHGEIFAKRDVEEMLPRLLGKTELLALSISGCVELSLEEPIFPTTAQIRGAIVLRNAAAGARQIRGTLQVVPDSSWPWPDNTPPAPMPPKTFEVAGVQSHRLTFALNAPFQPGGYRVALEITYDQTTETLSEPVGMRGDG